jgi:hypothetical protein
MVGYIIFMKNSIINRSRHQKKIYEKKYQERLKIIVDNIKYLRKKRKLTINELQYNSGCSSIAMLESGNSKGMTLSTIVMLSVYFGISIEQFLKPIKESKVKNKQ